MDKTLVHVFVSPMTKNLIEAISDQRTAKGQDDFSSPSVVIEQAVSLFAHQMLSCHAYRRIQYASMQNGGTDGSSVQHLRLIEGTGDRPVSD